MPAKTGGAWTTTRTPARSSKVDHKIADQWNGIENEFNDDLAEWQERMARARVRPSRR